MIKMVIKELTMKGFKNHKNTVSYKFSPFTTIYGENGKGKTTIADAISWCLTVADYTGKEKQTKDLTNNYSKLVEVSIVADVITDKGSKTKVFKRVNGGGQELDGFFINGEKVSSKFFLNDLNIEKDMFFSILNPFYFSMLNKNDAKSTILKAIKQLDNVDVLNRMEEYQKDILIKNGFKKDMNSFMIGIKDNISNLKKDEIYFEGSIDAKKAKINVPNMNINDHKENRQKLFIEIADLESKIKTLYQKEFLNQRLLDEKSEEINILKQKFFALEAKDNLNVINQLKSEIEHYRNYPKPQMPQLQDINILQKQINDLRNKYSELNSQLKHVKDIDVSCNKCGNIIVLNNPEKDIFKMNLSEVKESGISLASSLKKINVKNQKLEEKFKLELSEFNRLISIEIKNRMDKIESMKNKKEDSEIKKIREEIKKEENKRVLLINSLKKEKEDRNEEVNQLDLEIKKKLLEKQKIDQSIFNYTNLCELEEQRIKELEAFKSNLAKTSKDLMLYQNVLDVCKIFIGLKVKIQKAEFEKYLDKVDISLEKVVKSTGELKEDFTISYDGKEFNQLSGSERIKAGLELVNMFTKLKDIYLPIVVDNAESITDYLVNEDCQTIEMRVKKDSKLTLVG